MEITLPMSSKTLSELKPGEIFSRILHGVNIHGIFLEARDGGRMLLGHFDMAPMRGDGTLAPKGIYFVERPGDESVLSYGTDWILDIDPSSQMQKGDGPGNLMLTADGPALLFQTPTSGYDSDDVVRTIVAPITIPPQRGSNSLVFKSWRILVPRSAGFPPYVFFSMS